jgi:hypothetical protein
MRKGLKNVKEIESDFMASCHSIKTVDISPLENLESIHKGLLYDTNAKLIVSEDQHEWITKEVFTGRGGIVVKSDA